MVTAKPRTVEFFGAQFGRQIAAHDYKLNPFEELALPYLTGSALDLGCGLGNLSLAAASRGARVTAVDACENAVDDLAARALASGLDIHASAADLRGWRPAQNYDAVACIGLLMFFARNEALAGLSAVRDAVREGGVAVVNVLVEGTTYLEMFDPAAYHLFTREELVAPFAGWSFLTERADEFPAQGDTLKRFLTFIARRPLFAAASAGQFERAAALQGAPVGRARADAPEKIHELRAACVQARSRRGCLERKAHLDVGGRERLSGKPLALVELCLEVIEVPRDLGLDIGALHAARDGPGDGPHQERHGPALDPVEDQLEQERRHRRALGVVHPIAVSSALRGAGRGREAPLAVALDQVLQDGAGFCQRQFAVGDHRRLPQGVDLSQRLGRQHRLRVALVALDVVRQSELLQQPQDALRARVVEVMDDDHRRMMP